MMIGLMLVMSKKKKKTLKRSNKNGCAGGVLVIHGVLFFLDVMRLGQCRWHCSIDDIYKYIVAKAANSIALLRYPWVAGCLISLCILSFSLYILINANNHECLHFTVSSCMQA